MMTFKSLCAGVAVALAASTLGCGTSMAPTPPTPERESAMVSDQVADAAQPADVRTQYQTQAVVVRRRPAVVAPRRPVVVTTRRPVVVAPRRPVVVTRRPVIVAPRRPVIVAPRRPVVRTHRPVRHHR